MRFTALAVINDRHLALKALDMALKRRCPDKGLLHHSDQRSPCASEAGTRPRRDEPGPGLAGEVWRRPRCGAIPVVLSRPLRGPADGRGHTGVAQPMTDRGDIHAGAKQMDGRTVAHAVRMQPLRAQRGRGGLGAGAVFPKQIPDAEPGQASTTMISEQRLIGWNVATPFGQQGP